MTSSQTGVRAGPAFSSQNWSVTGSSDFVASFLVGLVAASSLPPQPASNIPVAIVSARTKVESFFFIMVMPP